MMKLITRETDYAIRVLMYIAESEKKIIPAPYIQNELALPKAFLRRILQTLQREGILTSRKGNNGGFILNCMPKDISLANIIEIFQGAITLNDCLLMKQTCPQIKKCVVREKIMNIENSLVEQLENVTISTLIECQ